jgi:hypothetical protein
VPSAVPCPALLGADFHNGGPAADGSDLVEFVADFSWISAGGALILVPHNTTRLALHPRLLGDCRSSLGAIMHEAYEKNAEYADEVAREAVRVVFFFFFCFIYIYIILFKS